MYNIVTKQNAYYGITGYQVHKDYFDSVKHKENKLIEEAMLKRKNYNDFKLKQYITKRGHF